MQKMTAVVLHRFGGTDGLRVEQVVRPAPGPGEVLVRIAGTSVNPVDLMIRRGGYPRVGPERLPYIGGRDVAGHVAETGAGVDPGWMGRAVWGSPDFARGTFAQHIVLKLSEASAAPAGLPLADAAAVPLAALTAWQGLHRHGGIAAGQRVLIHGGSGGVGHFAVQMAKLAGAEVLATASARNRGLLERLGADRAIAHDTERFEAAAGGVDLVLDLAGGDVQARSWAVLRPGGRLVSAVAEPDPAQVAAKAALGSCFFIAESDGGDLARIAGLVAGDRLRPLIHARFPLEELAAAQAALEKGGVAGKIAITVA
ncbi:NADP-dependent oxidoreductase [Mangrovicoccus sp. HB161399]|uniref:NADP-dependent oxidoreductase n=1 Tax=Mangrovicoccus sp. HB161399 TaxID=2720392 RepID=UPI0015566388|nr:NADP-dependent oxidoreductase [Mangrovicoccus sp. HB161399]